MTCWGRVALATTVCEIGAEFATARRAGEWVGQFYPDVSVTVERAGARLVADGRGEDALRMIWRSALATEALHARGAGRRAAIIAALVA